MKGVLDAGTLLVVLHLALQRPVVHRLVTDEVDRADLHLRAFVHVKRDVDELRSTADFGDLVLDVGKLKAFLPEHVADDAFNLANEGRIDERVESDRRVVFLQLLVNLRDLELLRADVVDNLDPLPLLHVVGDNLADRAVRKLVIGGFDEQVVEELGAPETGEIVVDRLFGISIPRHPLAPRRRARLELDVIEIGLRLD